MIALHTNKSCISRITSNVAENNHFTFQYVCTEDIFSKLMNIDCKTSSGYDGIQPRFIKIGARQLCGPVTQLVNKSIQSSIFPDSLKYAEVMPVFKKDDMLNKNNYRPVSILPCMSKIFEGVLVEQLITYFNDIFSSFLSGFRKQHSCHNGLLRYVENCKKHLDKNMFYGTLLTDLSKAFDCLPQKLLITKLKAYGVCDNACMLISSYFQERYQRVKVGNSKSQ